MPQTMLSPSVVVPQTMLSPSPVPHTMFCAHAVWFTEITSAPETTFVPQTMFCDHATFSAPNAVCGSTGVAIHVAPTGLDVSA